MEKTEHPWQQGPTELIEFALTQMKKPGDFDKRLAFLVLDLGVETLFKAYLSLPDEVTQFEIPYKERYAAVRGTFHDLLQGVQKADPIKAKTYNFPHIDFYHNQRNTIYHEGNKVIQVATNQLENYAGLAVNLLGDYLGVALPSDIGREDLHEQVETEGPITDSVTVKVSFGEYRIERLKSQTIRVFSVTENGFEAPVKPFLRAVIDELALPISLSLKTGVEKNTRRLGKEVIDYLNSKSTKTRNPRNETRYFDAGSRARIVRDELRLKPSEFAEVLGASSQREYEAMENREKEMPLELLEGISSISGVSIEWLKHEKGKRYNIEGIYLNPIEDDLKYCASLKPEEYFLTLNKKDLHVGLVVQRSKYNFQTLATGITLDFWNWVESQWMIPAFYDFLETLSGPWHDIDGLVLPHQVEKDLMNGDIHFKVAARKAEHYGGDLLYDILDLDETRGAITSYSARYGGNWMHRVHEYFHRYRR